MTTKEPGADALTERVVRAAMRAAIPVNDVGSRMAIQYAIEIAEFIDLYGFRIVEAPGHDPEVMRLSIEYMDRADPPMEQ
jgi:hypothetical protein